MLDFLKKKNPDLHEYHRNSHSKYLIQYHFVFAVKYRKKLLTGEIKDDIQQFFYDIAQQYGLIIKAINTEDSDHIHVMVDAPPKISPTLIVNHFKSISTFRIWKLHEPYLKTHFWKERTFWSDGYFVCSIGDASPETIKKYIDEQG